MHPSPVLNEYDFGSPEDLAVQDILSDDFNNLWHGTAEKNREAFKAVFLPVPTDDVRNWKQYADYLKPHAGVPVRVLDIAIIKDGSKLMHL
jgi:phospholipase D1/2